MRKVFISIPDISIDRTIILDGIEEPPVNLETMLSILTYKVGDLHENLVKAKRLESKAHKLEFKNNLAQVMCHCIKIALSERLDVSELVDLGWEYIGERFKDFEENWNWKGDEEE